MANLKEQAKALYLYGFPLVVTEATHWGSDDKGFHHLRTFPTDKVNKIVKLNNDTLYSTAWTQLAQTPYLVHIPKITERYYLFPILDAYTNVVESIGTRTPDRAEGDYILLYQDTLAGFSECSAAADRDTGQGGLSGGEPHPGFHYHPTPVSGAGAPGAAGTGNFSGGLYRNRFAQGIFHPVCGAFGGKSHSERGIRTDF